MLSTIQLWENLYLQWINLGERILLVQYENLSSDLRSKTLKDICNFLDFNLNEERLKCVLGHTKDTKRRSVFRRKRKCFNDKMTTNSGKRNINQSTSDNIFTKSHRIWINSAIRNVHQSLFRRGLVSSSITEYKDTIIKLNDCYETF